MNARPSAIARLDTALTRIASPELEGSRVFTDVFAKSARQEAAAADMRLAKGKALSPIDGRIVSVKALFDIAGTVTHAGSAIMKSLPPATADALVVKRLREAGAIIIGKTQMTEFAFSALGTNSYDGTPGNPHDRERVPGGSSSGAVVSVVDGMAEIAIGSDTGGSIRIPSALSGAVGFKPTAGRVPTEGVVSLSTTLDTIGPIGSTIADCAVADHVMSGTTTSAEILPAAIDSFHLTVPQGSLFDQTDSHVIEAFEQGLDWLRAANISVGVGSITPVLENLAEIDRIATFPSIELGATLRNLGFVDLNGIDPKTRTRIDTGAGVLAVDYVRITRMRQAAIRFFETITAAGEIYVLPTSPISAPLQSSTYNEAAFHTLNGLVLRNPRIANLLDCPSLSLPLPVVGLPVGLMLIGRRNSDRHLLEAGLCIEQIFSWHRENRLSFRA